MKSDIKPSFSIIGCGKVGTVLGKFLSDASYPVKGVASKSLPSALKAAQILRTDLVSLKPWEVTPEADIVFITTPDDSISKVCDLISQYKAFKKGAIVLHCSGSLPSTILSSAKTCKSYTGSMHPLQSIASIELKKNPFQGIMMSIEGENQAKEAAIKISKDLGSIYLTIETSSKTLYHAAGVVASNYLVTLLGFSFKLMEAAGISENDAYKALAPLINGTLSNIAQIGIPKALTGPIARGDLQTIKDHLDEIALKTPDLLLLYKTLGKYTIEIAESKGTISDSKAKAFIKMLCV